MALRLAGLRRDERDLVQQRAGRREPRVLAELVPRQKSFWGFGPEGRDHSPVPMPQKICIWVQRGIMGMPCCPYPGIPAGHTVQTVTWHRRHTA